MCGADHASILHPTTDNCSDLGRRRIEPIWGTAARRAGREPPAARAGALERPLVRRLAALLPVALLAALTARQTFADGHALVLDARAAWLGAAALAMVLRAPFLLVVAAAVEVSAGVRAMGG